MSPLITLPAAELRDDPSAQLWALVMYLAEHPEARQGRLKRLWLAYIYDAEVSNGGHLQYFHNHGSSHVEETVRSFERHRGGRPGSVARALLTANLQQSHS